MHFFKQFFVAVFPDEVIGEGFFSGGPLVRASIYGIVGPEFVDGFVNGIKDGPVVQFLCVLDELIVFFAPQ